jgi:hypothetical protein
MKLIYSVFFYFLSGFLLLYGQGSPACKTIYIGHENAAPGEQVCLDIKVTDFQEMLGTQFTLQWDTAMLEFSGLENLNLPDLFPSNFGTTPELLAQGKLTFLWFYITLAEEGYSLPDDETIFSVCFDVKGPSGSFAPLYFGQSPAPTELTGWPGPQVFENYVTIGGGVFIGDFPDTTPLELLSSCSFNTSCDSSFVYTVDIAGGNPPYAYEWTSDGTPLSNTPEVSFFGESRYQLKVTDANQQSLYVEFSSADNSLQINSSVSPTVCGQETGAIDIEVTGGSGAYDYLWSDNSTEAGRTELGAGTYGLTVTDQLSGCTISRQFEVPKEACDLDRAALSMSFATVAQNGGSVCVDFLADGLPGIKGFDITFHWDTTVVQLDYVSLLHLPGEENEVIQYNESGNSFSISRRYDQPVTFEDGAPWFLPCFTSKTDRGYSLIQFDTLQTQILLENDSLFTPNLYPGQIYIRSEDSLFIKIESAAANPEDTVCLAVTSENFTDISALQYALTWDNSILEFQGIEAGIFPTDDSIGIIDWRIDENQRGVLRFLEGQPEGWTIGNDEIHYKLCFVARSGGVVEINFDSSFYLTNAYNTLNQFVPLVGVPGLVNIGEVPPQAMLKVGENRGEVGEQTCVSFTGEQLEGVRQMDFSLQWDTSVIELSTVKEGNLPEFALSNWTLDQEESGVLTVSWQNDSLPLSFFRPQNLLELCFIGLQEGTSPVSFSEAYTFESDNPSPDPMFFDGEIVVVAQDSATDRIVVVMPDLTVAEGQSVCVPVYANQFANIVGMQYTHHWDSTVLKLDTILPANLPELSQRNFGPMSFGPGTLPVSWTYSQPGNGVSLPDSSLLYTLCFSVIGETGEATDLWIDGEPVSVEVVKSVDSDLVLIGLGVERGRVRISRDFVWPGDTDHNGIANHQDLLNIGLAYGQVGPERGSEADRTWAPMVATDWGMTTPETLLDYKHIDADGDGLIDAADTLAITENWGKTTPWYEAPEEEGVVELAPQQGAPLFVEAREEVRIGKNTFDVILGTEANPAEEVYGLAFSISYDYEGIQSDQVYAGFDATWLGTIGDNLLTMQRNNPEQNRIDIAITRTDGQNMSGRGAIASLHITIEDIILFQGSDDLIVFEIKNVRLINALEVDQPNAPAPSSMVVTQQTTPTDELLDERLIRVFPVPAQGKIEY